MGADQLVLRWPARKKLDRCDGVVGDAPVRERDCDVLLRRFKKSRVLPVRERADVGDVTVEAEVFGGATSAEADVDAGRLAADLPDALPMVRTSDLPFAWLEPDAFWARRLWIVEQDFLAGLSGHEDDLVVADGFEAAELLVPRPLSAS